MATDQPSARSSSPRGPVPPRGPAPLSAAVRHRLQKVYEHAQRCVDKGDHDYANQLLTQCVVEDPASDLYLKAFLDNLQRKYKNNKKGSSFAGVKIRGHRSALAKAAEKGDWPAAFQAGCEALAVNPWDAPTLIALARACGELRIDECRLMYLRFALDIDPKDPTVNREAALALAQMGQFDQAIACWHRVEQAKPHDEEAQQAISRLSVEKTIRQGGYDPELLGTTPRSTAGGTARRETTRVENAGAEDPPPSEPEVPLEERLREVVRTDPANLEKALQLADLYLQEQRLDDADHVLERARAAAGNGDLRILERLEEIQIRRAGLLVQQAQRHADHEQSPAAKELLERAKRQSHQVELEVFAARAEREPLNARLQWELGLRWKRTGKYKEAIQAFQAARSDSRRKSLVLIELGECFQKIEQYKLALSHYEQALEDADAVDPETRKLALYRAGVLATGLRELDRAERHLAELAGIDFGYRDVAERLDKIARLRHSG